MEMLIDALNKINMAFNQRIKAKRSYEVEDELAFIQDFPEPKDDIERAYFQYKCSCFLYEQKIILFFKNIVSLAGILYYMLVKCRKRPAEGCAHRYVFVFNGDDLDVVPDKYRDQLMKVNIAFYLYLNKDDKKFIRKIWKRYPFSFFFLFKCIVKLATYRAAIEMYHPQTILCSCENSYTSSILTMYCEKMGMEHINLMHGVVPISVSLAFHRFHVSSVWTAGVIETHKILRSGSERYEIEIPKCMRYDVKHDMEQMGRYTYYMQDTSEEILSGLVNVYREMQKRGISLILRPHPVFTNMDDVKRYLPEAEIEDTESVSIQDSINRAECIIARFSTVLWQAQIMKKRTMIDDISIPEMYEKLKKRRIFMWDEGAEKMSMFLQSHVK
ncbi:MAG: hypothetical protein K2N01_02000 [Lachnospiraceae bacterium]|nr:hypothetical protein [Lachnospiraceae bacterium]